MKYYISKTLDLNFEDAEEKGILKKDSVIIEQL